MKNRTLKVAASAASILAAVTLLSACGSNSSKKADAGNKNFTVATVRWSDWGTTFEKFPNKLAKQAGINVKWNVYLDANWTDKQSTMMAGGDLPDAFMGSITFTDQQIAQNQADFVPLNKYINKTDMPNLTKALKENPALKAMITSPDGKIWSLPKNEPVRPTIANQLFINKKWLDKLGLQMPTTYAEFVKVLQAFKTQDPNGDGKADEIPYAPGNVNPTFAYILPFGNLESDVQPNDVALWNGKPTFVYTNDRYKAGIQAMHTAYSQGLIDPQMYTEDATQTQANLMAKVEVVGVSAGWTADATFGANAKDYVALPPLKGPDGKAYIFSDPDHYNENRNEFMVTTKAKNVKALMKWVDKFYTNDASIQNTYGEFGVATKKTSTGYEVLKAKSGTTADAQAWVDSLRDFGPKTWTKSNKDVTFQDSTNGDAQKLAMDAKYKKYALPAYPNVTYTNAELTTMAQLLPDINSYATQQEAKWVTKGGLTDASYKAYVSKLNAMGLQKFMKIQTDAYNRYEKELKK